MSNNNHTSLEELAENARFFLNNQNTFGEYWKILEELKGFKPNKQKVKKNLSTDQLLLVDTRILFSKTFEEEVDTLIIMPSGGDEMIYDSIESLVSCLNFFKSKKAFALVLDGKEAAKKVDLDRIYMALGKLEADWYVMVNSVNIGYSKTLYQCLNILNKYSPTWIGFVDDDAVIKNIDHYNVLRNKLLDPGCMGASGLAVDNDNGEILHDFFNIPSSRQVHEFARSINIDTSKPHIHGGGGACLVERKHFIDSLLLAINENLLVGPSISSLASKRGGYVVATQDSMVDHATKSNVIGWIDMVKKYYKSWQKLTPSEKYESSSYYANYIPIYKRVLGLYSDEKLVKFEILCSFRKSFKTKQVSDELRLVR